MATEQLVVEPITIRVSADLVERIADLNEVAVVQVGDEFACVLRSPAGVLVTFIGGES